MAGGGGGCSEQTFQFGFQNWKSGVGGLGVHIQRVYRKSAGFIWKYLESIRLLPMAVLVSNIEEIWWCDIPAGIEEIRWCDIPAGIDQSRWAPKKKTIDDLWSPFSTLNKTLYTRARARFATEPDISSSVVGDSGPIWNSTTVTDITGLGEKPGTVRQVEVLYHMYIYAYTYVYIRVYICIYTRIHMCIYA